MSKKDIFYLLKVSLGILIIELAIRNLTTITTSFSIKENLEIGFVLSLMIIYSNNFFRLFLFLFLFLTLIIQSSYAIIYGSWITPTDLFLLFKHLNEVLNLAKGMDTFLLIKLFLTIIIFISLIIYLYKTVPKKEYKWFVNILVILIFVFQPIRDGIIHPDKIEKRFVKDTHSIIRSFHNVYGLSIAILLSKFFDKKIYQEYYQEPYKKLITNNIKPNIFIYYGESLSSRYMSLYGYNKKTTPFLDKLIEDNSYYTLSKETIAGAVATMTSTVRFFHMIKKPDGVSQSRNFNTNLFKYAKENNFQTTYITTQPENYMNHIYKLISSKYCDNYLSSPIIDNSYNERDNAYDELVFKGLKLLKTSNQFFIVFQPNGSHTPFSKRTYQKFKQFGSKSQINEYENSVYYSDNIFKQLLKKIEKLSINRPWVFIITSDHGTYVDDKIVTRSRGYKASYLVPCIIITKDKNIYNKYIEPFKKRDYLFHQTLSNIIARLIGMDIPTSKENSGILFEGMLNGYGTKKVVIKNHKILLETYKENF